METLQGLRSAGDVVWFEYHCWENENSADAELWKHSHRMVTILGVAPNDGMGIPTLQERIECGQLIGYTVRFADGYQHTAMEDELLDSTTQFERPAPPR